MVLERYLDIWSHNIYENTAFDSKNVSVGMCCPIQLLVTNKQFFTFYHYHHWNWTWTCLAKNKNDEIRLNTSHFIPVVLLSFLNIQIFWKGVTIIPEILESDTKMQLGFVSEHSFVWNSLGSALQDCIFKNQPILIVNIVNLLWKLS